MPLHDKSTILYPAHTTGQQTRCFMYHILYVDDEPGLLDLGKIFLEQSGEFAVDTAPSGPAGLALLGSGKYDAIISDFQMPEMDGIGFLKKVRASKSTIPFIIFTGRGREEIVIQALNEGADFYLQKGGEPVSQFTELAHKIRQAVQQRRAVASIRDHERREADIINFLPDATFAIDRSGHIIAWNRAIEEMTGVPAAEMLGKGDFEYAIPFYGKRQPILIDLINESDEVIARNYDQIVHEKDNLIAETSLPRPRGHAVTLMGKASPLYNRRGEIVGAIESIRDITDMKKAVERLSESEGRFAAFMDHLPVTAFIKDDRSTNLFVNRHMVEIFGEREWIGKSVFEQFPPEAAEKMVEDDQQTIREGYRKATEYLTDKNGRKRIYETYKFRIDQGDKPPLIGGFAIDISEQNEAEQALNKSKLRFRELADLLPQIVYEADTAGNLTYVNRIAFERFGYTEDEFRQGLTVLQMVAPRDREREAAAFRDIVAGKKPAGPPDEFQALKKDGSTFPVSISSSLVLVDGRVTGLRGILVDITERKRAEDLIRESEEKYRSILDALPDAVSVVDRELKVTFANITLRSWLRTLGFSDDIIGRSLMDAFPFLSPDVLDQYHEVFSTGTTMVTEESSKIGDQEIVTETRKIPLLEQSRIVAVVAIIREVTSSRKN
jgi:PAS domain S-box-containing protein